MKRLFYIRHGESEFNVQGRFAGRVETTLTKLGEEQAKCAGKDLKSIVPNFDLIISSPLQRTYDTAKIVAIELGYPIDMIVKHEMFVERAFGVLEGTYAINFLDKKTRKDIDNVDGAEKLEDMQERAIQALEYLKSLSEDNILVVSHGSFGKALRRVINNLPHTHEYLDEFRIGNSEIVELI